MKIIFHLLAKNRTIMITFRRVSIFRNGRIIEHEELIRRDEERGMRGRPPGSRRQWHDDDDDDDYDQYEDTHSRYGPRKQTAYRSSRRSQFIAFR